MDFIDFLEVCAADEQQSMSFCTVQCPLLALSGQSDRTRLCPLLEQTADKYERRP
jgi:hypothetical protein